MEMNSNNKQSSIPQRGENVYITHETPNNNNNNNNNLQYSQDVPVHGNGNGNGNGTGNINAPLILKYGEMISKIIIGIFSFIGFCLAADFTSSNNGGISSLIFSLISHLFTLTYMIIFALQIICRKSPIISLGGEIFVSSVLCILSIIAGSCVLADNVATLFCDNTWYENHRYCNDFKAAGAMNILCFIFFLFDLGLQCFFKPVISSLKIFFIPNTTIPVFENIFPLRDVNHNNQQIQSPAHPSTQV